MVNDFCLFETQRCVSCVTMDEMTSYRGPARTVFYSVLESREMGTPPPPHDRVSNYGITVHVSTNAGEA